MSFCPHSTKCYGYLDPRSRGSKSNFHTPLSNSLPRSTSAAVHQVVTHVLNVRNNFDRDDALPLWLINVVLLIICIRKMLFTLEKCCNIPPSLLNLLFSNITPKILIHLKTLKFKIFSYQQLIFIF